jgi:hypothetical protein
LIHLQDDLTLVHPTSQIVLISLSSTTGELISLATSSSFISFSATELTGVSSPVTSSFTSSTFSSTLGADFLKGFCHFLNTIVFD